MSPAYFWFMEEATLGLATTPLHGVHMAAGARMVPFAGYEMPVQYAGLRREHEAVRTAAGVFDVSHMGELWFSGGGARAFLQHLLAGDIDKAKPGRALYTCLLNEAGGIVEDLLVYGFESRYLLVVNAANRAEVVSTVESTLPEDVQFEDASDRMALIALQGPSSDAVASAMGFDLGDLKYYHHRSVVFEGAEVVVGATGYTGERGFEWYVPSKRAESLWNSMMAAGEEHGLIPCGLGARDTLRLEKGFCLHGNDIGPSRNPVEAGLSWVVGWDTEFQGKSALVAAKENGPEEKLVGFKLEERGIPRKDYPILDAQGDVIGAVTSGTQSPSLGEAIGLGYVSAAYAARGAEIYISIRNKSIRATVTRIPFL
jgi:aminomethyltransferase